MKDWNILISRYHCPYALVAISSDDRDMCLHNGENNAQECTEKKCPLHTYGERDRGKQW